MMNNYIWYMIIYVLYIKYYIYDYMLYTHTGIYFYFMSCLFP